MYNDLNNEDLRKGKMPDLNKNYLKAVDLVAKTKKTSSNVYGLGSANEVFYLERSIFHSPRSDLRRELDELHSVTNKFRTYINVQMTWEFMVEVLVHLVVPMDLVTHVLQAARADLVCGVVVEIIAVVDDLGC